MQSKERKQHISYVFVAYVLIAHDSQGKFSSQKVLEILTETYTLINCALTICCSNCEYKLRSHMCVQYKSYVSHTCVLYI